jgi:dihydroorotase
MQKNTTQINLIKPDDWHLHVRNGKALKSVISMTAKQMGRAIIMPPVLALSLSYDRYF